MVNDDFIIVPNTLSDRVELSRKPTYTVICKMSREMMFVSLPLGLPGTTLIADMWEIL